MKIDKSSISGTQFMFAIAFYLQSSALLISVISGVTKHESWIPLLFSCVLCIPLVLLFRTIMVMFPDKNFLQILQHVYGNILGTILKIAYVWFFLTVAALNTRDLVDFAKITFMSETPHYILSLVCVLIAIYAVRQGFNVVSRYSKVFSIVEFFIVAASILLLTNQINFKNLLPVFTQPVINYIQSTHIITLIPFGELVVFLMIMPCVKKLTPRSITKKWFGGLIMGMAVLLLVLVRDISILGNQFHLFTLPNLITLRLVNIGEAINRTEIIFTIALIMLLFFKITLLCYVSTVSIAELFKTVHYKHLALVVGVLIAIYGPTLYPNSVAHTLAARTTEPFFLSLFEFVIPLATLIIAKIRKLQPSEKPQVQEREV